MGSVGDFLLWTPIVILLSLGLTLVVTNAGFATEAHDRGFTSHLVNHEGCFVNGTSKFCESDYGVLGIRMWLDEKDQNAIYSLFPSGNNIPQNICKERVIDYNLTKTNDSYSLQVKCNS